MSISSGLENIAYISIGSNIGDRLCNCKNAIATAERSDDIVVESLSDFYFTEPMEFTDQSWFVNAALKIRTGMGPDNLLKRLKNIEQEMGRVTSNIRYGPRVIDFDIIFYNDDIIHTPELEIPHPRMHQREFVLRPLCDLAPDMIHPVFNKRLKQLLDEVEKEKQRCIKINSNDEIQILYINQENKTDQEEVNDEIFH